MRTLVRRPETVTFLHTDCITSGAVAFGSTAGRRLAAIIQTFCSVHIQSVGHEDMTFTSMTQRFMYGTLPPVTAGAGGAIVAPTQA
jgi:hypothetical protein